MDKEQEARVAKALQSHEERLKKLESTSRESSPESSDLVAQLKEETNKVAQLAEQVTLLEQENAALKERSDALEVLEGLVKSPEGFVELATQFGYAALIPPDLERTGEANAEAAAAETPADQAPVKRSVVEGQVEDPDYEFIQGLGVSILKPKAPKEG
jgi:TolA-binding protein